MHNLHCIFVLLEIECGSPPIVENSATSITGTSYKSEVTYYCNHGYAATPLTASGLRQQCDIDGKWSGPTPQCLGLMILTLKLTFSICLLCLYVYMYIITDLAAEPRT